ncbi:UDP-N-acetylmuramate dehydrogenase [Conexibacter sp. CPCC 206217]|uniref:UDP-N-acetylmuramate dehydrogenase n=1 Tax=Conexibacter sp. CPCC 206217 TaxID=3064574 RepID=UPI00351C2D1D
MRSQSDTIATPLAPLTTLRLGGPARRLIAVTSETELVSAVTELDAAGEPLLVLAGGSNVVIADAGFDGTVVHVRTYGISPVGSDEAILDVQAGEPWDGVVAYAVEHGLAGIEALSGIPGSAGATPIQNVGAYGQDVSQTIVAVRVLDRASGHVLELPAADCDFRYRTSAFKGRDERIVLSVRFGLGDAPTPIAYAELARALGVAVGARAPLADVRAAVLGLRRGKGMVVDPADPDSVSAGSFFTNPILAADAFAALAAAAGDPPPPAFPEPDGRVKTSAAWLIQHAGFERGTARGRVGISSKHTLALVNRGGATTAELVAFAREIAAGVERAFGVRLVPEPVFVGHRW